MYKLRMFNYLNLYSDVDTLVVVVLDTIFGQEVGIFKGGRIALVKIL